MESLEEAEKYEKAKDAFYPLIKLILIYFNITTKNFQKKLKIIEVIKICLTKKILFCNSSQT